MTETIDICPGCGVRLPVVDGPVHAYMRASPACWAAFGKLLNAEYSGLVPYDIHRLSVDCYAVQHPGDGVDRRAVQSVGLHLARLYVQLETRPGPTRTNQIMLGFAKRKASLKPLEPPAHFTQTIADITPFAGTDKHADKVNAWAKATWADYAAHHEYIKDWVGAG